MSNVTDPADLLPFSKEIAVGPDDIIPKDPIQNEVSMTGNLAPVKRKKVLLFLE